MKSNDYQSFRFECAIADQEILIAFLSNFEFESFVQEDWGVNGYIHTDAALKIDSKQDFTHIPVAFKLNIEDVPKENWNAKWESQFTPVEIDEYLRIRADFHASDPAFKYEIVINPRMAFGTGHHETTFMMSRLMGEINLDKKSVLDYGAGTGVLAILAAYEGAEKIDAIDYDVNSYTNMMENFENNKVPSVNSFWGELGILMDNTYDVILANINRQVLLDNAKNLRKIIANKGTLLLSGILDTDYALIEDTYRKAGFQINKKEQRGDWLCLRLTALPIS